MEFEHAHVVPVLTLFWFPCTFIITYVIAVVNKDVSPVFPYISDTGTWTPESCVFGQLLNMGSVIMGLDIYFRYLQVSELSEKLDFTPHIKKWNYRTFIMGLIAITGVSLVGNFQETNEFVVHVLGASAAFGVGSLYMCIQAYLSFKMFPAFGTRNVNYARVVLATICVISNNLTAILGILSFVEFNGEDFTKWTPEYKGYYFHFGSAVAEWILAFSTMVFIFTYYWEFKELSITLPKANLKTPQK